MGGSWLVQSGGRSIPRSPPRDGGGDADLVLLADGGVQIVEVADVLVIHVDVDETAELTAIENAFPEGGVRRTDVAENLADGRALGVDAVVPPGVGAERGRDANDGHD